MKTPAIIIFLAVLMALPCLVHAQPGVVDWSALDAGFAVVSVGNSRVTSVVGQT